MGQIEFAENKNMHVQVQTIVLHSIYTHVLLFAKIFCTSQLITHFSSHKLLQTKRNFTWQPPPPIHLHFLPVAFTTYIKNCIKNNMGRIWVIYGSIQVFATFN